MREREREKERKEARMIHHPRGFSLLTSSVRNNVGKGRCEGERERERKRGRTAHCTLLTVTSFCILCILCTVYSIDGLIWACISV